MKKLFFIFILFIELFLIEKNACAQSLHVDSVIGFPAIVIDSQVVGMSILVSNTGGANFVGDFAVLMNSTQHDSTPDTLYYTPNDTIFGNSVYDTIVITHTFYAADLDDGDNIVVVWPSSSQSSLVHDSLYFNLFFDHVGILENNPPQMVQLFPVPSAHTINLKIAHPEKVEQVRVFDIIGKELLRFDEAVSGFSIESLNSGVYLVEVINLDQSRVVKKFFRE